jgi:hypothetical protein
MGLFEEVTMMVDRNVVVDRDVWSIPQRLSWTGISAGVLVGLVTTILLLFILRVIGWIELPRNKAKDS